MALSSAWKLPAPADDEAPVLVLRALGLGDGIAAVPALRELRRALPGRQVVLACAHPVARLLHAEGLVDRVLPAGGLGGAPPGLALGRHLAVNLHGRGPQSHRLLLAGGAAGILAFASPDAGVDGPAWDDAEHEVARWRRLVGSLPGASAAVDPRDLRLTPLGPRGDVVVLHPGAASLARRWPAERWARVAAALAAGGSDVVLTGSADEAPLVEAIAAGAALPRAAALAGRQTLDDLAALVSVAGLLLSGDTGVAHLATAYGTPSVLLFGPTPPSLWGPAADPHLHRVLWHGTGRGDPHAPVPDPALLHITVDEVLDAVAGLAGGQRPALRLGQAVLSDRMQ